MLFIKYFFAIIIFSVCFALALNTYRLFIFINKHTFTIVFKYFKLNLDKHKIKLSTNLDFNYKISFKEILNSEHKYFFFLITPPALAIYIRSVYSEYHNFNYGVFMLITFILLVIGIYLYFFYRHLVQLKNLKLINASEIFIMSTKIVLTENDQEFFVRTIEKDCSNFSSTERVFKLEY